MGRFQDIALVHPEEHINFIHNKTPEEGLFRIDDDTTLSPGTWEAALRAVGASCRAVDEVMTSQVTNAFCAIRPPGHHAEIDRAMGFCYFNNAAVAARHAQTAFGVERVAIIDFDVHHGNGTQDVFWNDPSVMYTSTHQAPLYPGTGQKQETGEFNNIVNVPMRDGDGGVEFRDAYKTVILPQLRKFKPDLLVLSAGFDAHARDPLGGMLVIEDDFAWLTRELMEIADQSCNRRIVSLLEGGYDLEGLARSVAAHVMTLMEH